MPVGPEADLAYEAAQRTAAMVWGPVLIFALVAFGVMVAVCGILGFRDILSLFRTLEEEPDTLYEDR